MKYAWGSITKSCINFGNLLIEDSLQALLREKGFGKPSLYFDTIESNPSDIVKEINKQNFVIVPGCTTLTLEDYPGLKTVLPQIKIPIFNLGAAFAGRIFTPKLNLVRIFFQPIGSRDPFTHKYLEEHSIQSDFIGCPTLFSGKARFFEKRNSNRIVVGLGYQKIDFQIRLIEKLIERNYEVEIIIQERNQLRLIQHLKIKRIAYNPQAIIQEIANARMVLSARLHAALPAIANGTPVFFLKTMENTRFSLLEYLDIPIYDIEDPNIESKLFQFAEGPRVNPGLTYKKVADLKEKFSRYIETLKKIEGLK